MIYLDLLENKGYHGADAEMMSRELSRIDKRFNSAVEAWLQTGVETEYEISGVKLSDLVREFKMTYAAAILTMDWVLREPEEAKEAIRRGIR